MGIVTGSLNSAAIPAKLLSVSQASPYTKNFETYWMKIKSYFEVV